MTSPHDVCKHGEERSYNTEVNRVGSLRHYREERSSDALVASAASTRYYREEQPWGATLYDILPDSYVSFRTARQLVELVTSPVYGRMLFLDGCLQSATADEAIYHQALVMAGDLFKSRRVLIAGGAEGATAREVLKWASIDECVMVEWDGELVEYLRTGEKFNERAFNDRRLKIVHEDILKYLIKYSDPFDTVFLDLLDANYSDDMHLFKKIITCLVGMCKRVVMNIGRSRAYARDIGDFCEALFEGSTKEIISIHVPSFHETWYLLAISC